MHEEQRERARSTMAQRGIDRALFANPLSITWLTGFAPPPQLGPPPSAGGPALVWYDDGTFTLIVLESYAAAVQAADYPVVTYPGATITAPVTGRAHLAAALRETAAGSTGQCIGVEEGDLPASLWTVLRETRGATTPMVPIDGLLEPLQTIKTAEEIVKLRENFALTDIGHAAARRAVHAGLREIDLWVAVESAIQQAAGQRVPVGNDCVVGYRQNNIGGWPGNLEIRPHDSVIVDLSTLLHGYWSDSCATYYAGEPTEQQRAMHETVTAALEFGVALIRPGAVAREIDQKIRGFIVDAGYPAYPHHTGHSVGLTGHGGPRIVPYNAEVLEEGMVLMLEPGIYVPGKTSVRLEDGLLVTATGAEVLTHHDKTLP